MISWSTIHESAALFSRSHVGSEGSGLTSLSSTSEAGDGADIVTEEAALHAYEAGYEDAIRKSVVESTRLEALKLFRGIMARMDSSPFKSAEIYFLCMCNVARTLEALGRSHEAYREILMAVELRPNDFHAVFKAASLALDVGDTWTCRRFLESDIMQRHALKSILALMLSKCDKLEETKPTRIRRPPLPSASMPLWIRRDLDSDWSFLSQLQDPDLWTRPFVAIRDIEDSSTQCKSADDSQIDIPTDDAVREYSASSAAHVEVDKPEPSSRPHTVVAQEVEPLRPPIDLIRYKDSGGAYTSCGEATSSSSSMICVAPGEEEDMRQQQPGGAEAEVQKEAEGAVSAAVEVSNAHRGTNSVPPSTSASRRSSRRAPGPSQDDGVEIRCEIAESVRATLARLYPEITDRITHLHTVALSNPLILHEQFMYDRACEILTRVTQPLATVMTTYGTSQTAADAVDIGIGGGRAAQSSSPETVYPEGDSDPASPPIVAGDASEDVVLKLNKCMTEFREKILGFSGGLIPTSQFASMFISISSEAASCLLSSAWTGACAHLTDRVMGLDILLEAMRKNAVLMAFVARVSHRRTERGGVSGLDALEEEMCALGEAEALLVLECCGDWQRFRCDGGRRGAESGDVHIGLLNAASFYDFARKTSVLALHKFSVMKANKADNPQGCAEAFELTRVRQDWARFIFDMNAMSHHEHKTSRQSMSSVAASEFLTSILQRTNKQINFPYLRSVANVLCEASIGLAGNSQPVKEMLKEYGQLSSAGVSGSILALPDALSWAMQAVGVLEERFDTSAFVSALRTAIANDFECMNQSILGNDTALVVLFMRIVEVISGVDRGNPGDVKSMEVRSRLVRLAAEAVKSHFKVSGPEPGEIFGASAISTDQGLMVTHMDWIDVLLRRMSSDIIYSMRAVSESAVCAQLSWRKRPDPLPSGAVAQSNSSPLLQAAVALIHVMFCVRVHAVSSAGHAYRLSESIFGSCLQLIAAIVSSEIARIGRISEDQYDTFYRYIADHILSVCFSMTARSLGSAESTATRASTEAASILAATILLHRAPDASIAFLPQFAIQDSELHKISKLDALNRVEREAVLNRISQLLWLSELIAQLEKNNLPICSSNYVCLAEAILVLRHQSCHLEVNVKEGLDTALVSAFEAARSKIPDCQQYYGIIEAIDMFAINSLMPIVYSIRTELGCGGVLRYGNGARRLFETVSGASFGVTGKEEEERDVEPYDPETTEKLVLFLGQILFDRFDLPVFDTVSCSAPSGITGRQISRSIPNELAFDIYSLITYAKSELALVSRTSWKTCLSALYNMEAFRHPPPSDLTSELRSYLFEHHDEIDDMLSRARSVVECVDGKQRIVRDRIEAADAVLEGDEFIEIKSTFYYECLIAGVAYPSDNGDIDAAEDASIAFLDSWGSSDLTHANNSNSADQGVQYQSVVIDLREHCDLLVATQRRVCPNMLLAWRDLSYNNDIRDSTDTLERILIGFYELASASMEELSKLCFPPGILASLYSAAARLSWPGHSGTMIDILNILTAIRIPAHRIPALEVSESGDAGSSDVSMKIDVCCHRSSETLTCRAMEAMFNKYGSIGGTPMDEDGSQGFDYSVFELLAQFLCRYHKTVATLFHRAADLLIATKFASPSAIFSEVPAVCDAVYLEEFVKRASLGAVLVESFHCSNEPDGVACMVAAEKKALVSVAELRVLLEYSLSVLFHREDHISAKQACFQRTLRHCVQGFIFSIQLDTLSYFLPTFAADLSFRLGLGLQSVHYFLHQAEAAFKALSVDKKLRIHILHVYHNLRLQTSLNWLFRCYDYVNVNGSQYATLSTPAFDLLALTDDLSILDTFKVSSLEAPPASIASTTIASSSAPAQAAFGAQSTVSGFGIATITTGSLGTIIPSPIVLTSEITSSMQIGSPVSSFSPGGGIGTGGTRRSVPPSLVRAISHLWSTVLEALAGLRLCRKLDVWDAKSIYTISKAIVEICDHNTIIVPECVRASLQLAEITLSVSWAADLMWRLFEKRRPQVVALWKTEKGTGSRFDQIFQQDFKYDLARMKYFTFMIKLLLRDAPTQLGPRRRLVEMASAALATRERSAVTATMARCAVDAVLRVTAWDPIDICASQSAPAAPAHIALSVDPAVANIVTSSNPVAVITSATAPDAPLATQSLPSVFGVPYPEFNQLTQLAVSKRASHDVVCIHKARALALFMARCLCLDIERANQATSSISNLEVIPSNDLLISSNTMRPAPALCDPESLEYPDLLRFVADLMARVVPAAASSSTGLKRSRQSTGKKQSKSSAALSEDAVAVSKPDMPLPISAGEPAESHYRIDGSTDTPEALSRTDVGVDALTARAASNGLINLEETDAPGEVNDPLDMLKEQPPNKRAHIM